MVEEPGFIVKFYDKAYEDKSIIDLAKAPVAAISGVSEARALSWIANIIPLTVANVIIQFPKERRLFPRGSIGFSF